MSRLRWREVVPALLVSCLLSVAACSGGEGETQPPPTTPSASPPPASSTPSPTPAPSNSSEADDAQAAVVQFWAMVDRLSSDPEASLTDIFTVARGQVADQYIQNINQYRAEGVHQVGSVSVQNLAAERQTKGNRYNVAACLDVSGADVVDKRGKSKIADDRAPRLRYQYEVLSDSGGWYVVREQPGQSC